MSLEDRVKCHISDDEQECKVTISPKQDTDADIEIMDFIDFLNSKGIIYGIDETAIMENVINANSSTEAVTFIAAQAVPPIKGKQANINFAVPFPFEKNKITNEHMMTSLSGFSATEEQLLFIIDNNNTDGIDGTTVLGKAIKAENTQPTKITAGRGIKLTEKDKKISYMATGTGKVHLDNNKIVYLQPYQDGYFSINISEDKLRLTLSLYPPRGEGKYPCIEDILMSFQDQKIPLNDADKIEIKKLLYQLALTQTPLENILLKEGRPPQNGADAKISFKVHTEPQKIFNDTEGKINFYDIMKINEVKEGDLLAIKTPATPAVKNGIDIYGNPIPATDGKDIKSFEIGTNVRISEDGLAFFAKISGQVKYKNNVLRVIPVYVVDGDVDFSTGNIRFSGDIIIKGNVLDNFEVHSDETITVYNNIGAAKIYAGNNLLVKNGIINKKKSDIVVKGNLRTRFIENSSLIVYGDVLVEDYILQSEVESQKSITVSTFNKGQIIGSVIMAKNSVSTKSIGNATEIYTKILVGILPFINKKLTSLKLQILNIQKDIANETKSEDQINQLKTTLEMLLEEQTKLLSIKDKKTECLIKVKNEIYPNTELVLNDKTIAIKKLTTFRKFLYDIEKENVLIQEYH